MEVVIGTYTVKCSRRTTMSPGSRPSGTPSQTSAPMSVMSSPTPTRTGPIAASAQFHPAEEIAQLEGGRVRRVGAMRRVVVDRRAKLLAERAGLGLRRIRGAHQRAPLHDGFRRLEAHHDAGPGGHEIGQAAEERPRAVHVIEAFGVALRHVNHPERADAETRLFDAAQDLAGIPLLDRVRLDD